MLRFLNFISIISYFFKGYNINFDGFYEKRNAHRVSSAFRFERKGPRKIRPDRLSAAPDRRRG